jgi:hypothetical protein
VTPSIPEDFQVVAQATGRERFASFLQMLGQRLATGQKVFREVATDINISTSGPLQK